MQNIKTGNLRYKVVHGQRFNLQVDTGRSATTIYILDLNTTYVLRANRKSNIKQYKHRQYLIADLRVSCRFICLSFLWISSKDVLARWIAGIQKQERERQIELIGIETWLSWLSSWLVTRKRILNLNLPFPLNSNQVLFQPRWIKPALS